MDSQDRRTKRQKLKDMAAQTESPNEAQIAKKKLEELGPEIETEQTITFITFKFENVNINDDFFKTWSQFHWPKPSGFGEY